MSQTLPTDPSSPPSPPYEVRDHDTSKPGDTFRDEVAAMLRADGWEVRCEVRVGSMRVDVLAEKRDFDRRRRLAAECKDWGRPLRKDDLAQIKAKYDELIDNNEVDNVLVVAPLPLAADPKAYVDRNPRLRFQTFAELVRAVFDAERYLQYLVAQFDEDGLASYYVPIRLDDNTNAEEAILSWLDDADAKPLALLADYGMGKTTLARRLAHRCATAALKNPEVRIPVLVPLGELATEQDLRGLMGKVLTDIHGIRNYSFPLFQQLNREGRLFVILDGFDEMKHAMGHSAFEYTFGQLNRLVDGRAKVLLLGRPSAFLSDLEAGCVLRGRRVVGALALRDPNAPEYREQSLAPFDPKQAATYVERYLLYCERSLARSASRAPDEAFAARRARELHDDRFSALLSRPVHGRMLVELATDPEVQLAAVNEHDLYELFVTSLTRREADKLGRRAFGYELRLQFAEDLAWWAWESNRVSGFAAADVPNSLIEAFRPDPADSLEAVRRDLLAGCFLETKAYGVVRFPHRSFVEFLVARHLRGLEPAAIELPRVSRAMNSVIASFIEGSGTAAVVYGGWFDALQRTQGGQLSLFFLDRVAEAVRRGIRPAQAAADDSAWLALVKFLPRLDDGADAVVAARHAVEVYRIGRHPHAKDVAILMLLLAARRLPEARTVFFVVIAALTLAGVDPGTVRSAQGGRWTAPIGDRGSTAGLLFSGACALRRVQRDLPPLLEIKPERLFVAITDRLSPAVDFRGMETDVPQHPVMLRLIQLEPPHRNDDRADGHLFRRTGCDQVLSRSQFTAMRQLILQIDGLGSVISVTRQSGRPGAQVPHHR